MTTTYRINDRVVFRDGRGTRAGTLKRIISVMDKRGRDISKAVLETTVVDMGGKTHASVATVRYSAIVGYEEQEKREVAP